MSYSGVKDVKAQPSQPVILKEDEKIPLFLIKLWNIVEDPAYFDVIRWDDTGYSFHILDPYSFCRNVLPQYFKHNNLNSLIRQLNMYGFRKMTPLERTSLARAESDQDHLEFSHPCFVREHPELLVNIKRKAPTSRQHNNEGTVSVSSKDLTGVFDELKRLRERQKDMETKMTDITKENEMVWQELGHMRGAHVKQQQIVTKLVQFMVALLQPSKQQRLGKRNVMAIDEFQPKRARVEDDMELPVSAIQNHNVGEILDRLMQQYGVLSTVRNPQIQDQVATRRNPIPIISDVTDELNNLPTSQPSTTYPFYNNQQYSQQQPSRAYPSFSQTGTSSAMPVNSSIVPNIATNKRPLNVQPPLGLQRTMAPQSVYSLPGDAQETVPIVCSPPDNVSLAAATSNNEDPIINSPTAGAMNFNQSDFSNYLNDIDNSIDNCRGMIGGHWDDLDLDGLLNSYNDENPLASAVSPQNPSAQSIQQPSTATGRAGTVGFVRAKNQQPYSQN